MRWTFDGAEVMGNREATVGGVPDDESARRLAQRLAAGESVPDDEFAALLGPGKRRRSWPRLSVIAGSLLGAIGLGLVVWPVPGGLFDRVIGVFMAATGVRIVTRTLRRISLKKAGVIR